MIMVLVTTRPVLRMKYSRRENSFRVSSILRDPLDDRVAGRVEDEIGEPEHAVFDPPAPPPQQRPDPGEKLLKGKRLREIIVRARS